MVTLLAGDDKRFSQPHRCETDRRTGRDEGLQVQRPDRRYGQAADREMTCRWARHCAHHFGFAAAFFCVVLTSLRSSSSRGRKPWASP